VQKKNGKSKINLGGTYSKPSFAVLGSLLKEENRQIERGFSNFSGQCLKSTLIFFCGRRPLSQVQQ